MVFTNKLKREWHTNYNVNNSIIRKTKPPKELKHMFLRMLFPPFRYLKKKQLHKLNSSARRIKKS